MLGGFTGALLTVMRALERGRGVGAFQVGTASTCHVSGGDVQLIVVLAEDSVFVH